MISNLPDQPSTLSSSGALSSISVNILSRSAGTIRRGHSSADTYGGLSYLSDPPPPFGYPIESAPSTISRVPSYHSLVPHSYPRNKQRQIDQDSVLVCDHHGMELDFLSIAFSLKLNLCFAGFKLIFYFNHNTLVAKTNFLDYMRAHIYAN